MWFEGAMRAYEIRCADGTNALHLTGRLEPKLGPGQVLVRLRRVFEFVQARAALHCMKAARHLGKIVIRF